MVLRIKEIIFQDVKSENETKKVAVILRLNSVVMCIYFLCLICTFYITGEMGTVLRSVPCFFAYAFVFYTTYQDKTKLATILVQLLMLIWIIVFVKNFGWEIGVQHFIFVLLILDFTLYYSKISTKIIMGFFTCAIRLSLFAYTQTHVPVYTLTENTSVMFQIINTVFVVVSITAILAIFAEDSQKMEKKLVVYNEKLHKLASIDPLTGLMNRRSMKEYLEQKEAEGREGGIDSLSLALGDIDLFKRVNDTYGHECGDIVLKQLSLLFMETIGEKGKISRWGGEEFLFVFNNMNGDEVMIILNELQRCIMKMQISYKGEFIKTTMTFGLSEYDFQRGMDYSIQEADSKLYKGKESGRNKIVY